MGEVCPLAPRFHLLAAGRPHPTMSPPAIPKVAIPPQKWTASIYGAPDGCLAKPEVGKLGAMQFDPTYWSNAYNQCIGSGMSHKECVASLSADTRTVAPGPLASESTALNAAIECIGNTGDVEKCASHFDDLKKLAGYKDPVQQTTSEKVGSFCSKAGYKLLAVPVVFYGLKFIKPK